MLIVCLIGLFAALFSLLIIGGIWHGLYASDIIKKTWSLVLVIVLCVAIGIGASLFYTRTESGRARIKDFRASIAGMERNVRVYTADGTLLAEYEGRFNIRDENGGVMFEVDGVRYIYWNCFIESVEKTNKD